jgi:uncharacterized protein YjbI with pentapeptide repeats
MSKRVTIMSAESKQDASAQPDATPQSSFLGRRRRRLGGNSLWNWLDLSSKLAIPLVVVIATIGFGWWQAHLADQQHKSDQHLADQQHKSDQHLADMQQQAAIVQTYVGNMQDLLLHHGLSEFKPGGEVYRVAKEQTILTLGRLDAQHNTTVLQFLQNAGLVGVLDLSNADLSNDYLSGAHLGGIGLIGTTLTAADMTGADLSGATMYGADLSGAHLSGATLTGASLSAASLSGADLSGAHLSNATFVDADLTGARLNGATLTAVRLNGAHMSHADLSGAILSGADLTSADLTGANLTGANLTGANLSDVRDAPKPAQLKSGEAQSCPYEAPPKMVKHPITLTYWYTESGTEACAILEQINQFERGNPGIKINAMQKPFLQTRGEIPNGSHRRGARSAVAAGAAGAR